MNRLKYSILAGVLVLGSFGVACNCGQTLVKPEARQPYYHTEYISDGQVRVVCDNNGDATVYPGSTFGTLVVSCGTKD